ncbi:helix-turn-helix domain-containing protein [Pseudoglutamicibacter cumminsii]|uniref:helix-turn-helix domain-containing protein n=1 Tax=Pseudoglutamicibacter cumminsii TaxID=156979 RepID=UPI001956DAFE|nr:helix-turn-helix domain-containing protein [Pseudoglutamicibacter cumminsii]MBM7795810.1 excisionase family DNA binding protein [Pseudoglutamicibacter cumminsii]
MVNDNTALDVKTAAEVLGVSMPTVRALLNAGELKGYRMSDRVNASWRTTNKWIAQYQEHQAAKTHR